MSVSKNIQKIDVIRDLLADLRDKAQGNSVAGSQDECEGMCGV